MNKVILIGRVGADPIAKTLRNGSSMVKFSVATKGTYTPKGKDKPDPDWHNIVAWGKTAEYVERFNIRKGAKIAIEGKLKPFSYKKDNSEDTVKGVNVEIDTFELLDSKSDTQSNLNHTQLHPHPDSIPVPTEQAADDDDLPF